MAAICFGLNVLNCSVLVQAMAWHRTNFDQDAWYYIASLAYNVSNAILIYRLVSQILHYVKILWKQVTNEKLLLLQSTMC